MATWESLLILSLYLHQPESHQLSLRNISLLEIGPDKKELHVAFGHPGKGYVLKVNIWCFPLIG